MKQLSLFPNVVKIAQLIDLDSPRRAFYNLKIEDRNGRIAIVKESGAKGRVLDRRIWSAPDLKEAIRLFEKRIASKTDVRRKSPRKYKAINSDAQV